MKIVYTYSSAWDKKVIPKMHAYNSARFHEFSAGDKSQNRIRIVHAEL